MHPDLEPFRILSESKSHHEEEDQFAILLAKEAHTYAASYIDSKNLGKIRNSQKMYPKQRNIQIQK